ncbi:hypothetical protein F5876DRAFT_83729 [Lentinula aff. lateritia]|uniref:Uncharacterized protein n=1 Tax=Lentinula aff. lateritia TaxID=2804960 RepID=A0ACC1TI74_9AGAR|nr:hypothetical protein F5876DRAFT_83729 [Lentinula aff. lateritia]
MPHELSSSIFNRISMPPQMDHSVHIEPPTFFSNGRVFTADSQMSTSTRACRKFPYDSARRRPSTYGLPLPSASSFPVISQPTPSYSGQITASHHLFPGPPPSCYSRPCPSMKIPKPPGEVGRPGRGGYNLRKILGWSRQDYDNLKTIAKFDFVARYDNNWVIDDFVRCQLKYQRTVTKNRNRRRETSTITDGIAIQNAVYRFHKSLKYFGDFQRSIDDEEATAEGATSATSEEATALFAAFLPAFRDTGTFFVRPDVVDFLIGTFEEALRVVRGEEEAE